MKKIVLFISVALATPSAQPVTRKALEKAHTITGIISTIGLPAGIILGNKIENNYAHEKAQARASGNINRINAINEQQAGIELKSILMALSGMPVYAVHRTIGAALEKEDILVMRIMNHFLDRICSDVKLDNPDNVKTLGIEVVAAITYEILHLGLNKSIEKNFSGPNKRISRRTIRTIAHSLMSGLLELAKQMARDKWAPHNNYEYDPKAATLAIFIGRAVTEIGGEILHRYIEKEAQNLEVVTQVVPQPQA